jgi:Uma2 family endonuclease
MTVPAWPDHLLTIEEFVEFPEGDSRRYELQEGVPIVSPAAPPLQRLVAANLMVALRRQLPPAWKALGEVRVITDSEYPPSVWVPDLVIVATELAGGPATPVPAERVLIAVEIISVGSRGIDTRVKPVEYAKAGILHYWVIDPEEPLSMVAHHRADDGHYRQVPAGSGWFETEKPFPLQIDLAELRRPGLSEGRD